VRGERVAVGGLGGLRRAIVVLDISLIFCFFGVGLGLMFRFDKKPCLDGG
jgi:hypothetical protein